MASSHGSWINTDDLRDSPALALARQLQQLGAEVATFDPAANGALHSMARGWLSVARSAGGAAQGADAMVIATDWPEFASLDYARIRQVMRGAIMVDARSIVRADSLRELGFEFYSFTSIEHSNGSTENGSTVPAVHTL